MKKPRILWVGQCGVETGFARVTHNILPHLSRKYDIAVSAIGYDGDPHSFPWRMYSATKNSNTGWFDAWGLHRINEIMDKEYPDVVLIVMEPWHVEKFVAQLRSRMYQHARLLAYVVVDGENMKPGQAAALDMLDGVVFPCDFALHQAQAAGMKSNRWAIIPHGVDPRDFQPTNKAWARRQENLDGKIPADAFIIGNINMNQPRKRLDISVEAFAKFWHAAGKPEDVYLYLHHIAQQAEMGWDIPNLSKYYGVNGHVFIPGKPPYGQDPKISLWRMKNVYSALDVQMSTTAGEGFGLTSLEGMACGVPQVIPQFSAYGIDDGKDERGHGGWVAAGSVHHVPVVEKPSIMGLQQNVFRFPPDVDAMAEALEHLYRDVDYRIWLGEEGRRHALSPQFRWSRIACSFDETIQRALNSAGASGKFMMQKVPVGPSGQAIAAR